MPPARPGGSNSAVATTDAAHDGCALRLRGYGAAFGSRVILSSVDLALPAAGVDVLMGPVKTGKSTLLRSLAGLNQGNALFRSWGQASVHGVELAGAVRRPLLVQQHATVLNASLRDALVFHARQRLERSPAHWAEFARGALEAQGLAPLAGALDAPMLSLPVERQRALNILSHALAEPPLLLVDEPTYGLDDAAANWLVDWLAALGRRCRLMVVLHHQGQARRLGDRIVLLGGGRVLAHEASAEFFRGRVNAWVEQFVRSGSLAIASPDARPEELNPDVEPPPPLPPEALAAIRPFVDAAAARAKPAASSSALATAETLPASPPPPPLPPPPPAPSASPPPPPMRPAATPLPPVSRHGVDDASMVGRAIMSAYRGPQGFSWIVPGKLAGCAEPGILHPMRYDLDLLVRMGVTRLVTLTERDLDQAALAEFGLANLHLPIFDREAPSVRQTYMLVRRIQSLMDEGHVVAVHCKAGIGRTGTVLAAWMIREGGLGADAALQRLRSINPAYVQTETQERFLHEFELDILKRT